MSKKLLTDIEDFLRETGISESHFGRLSVKNGRLVERLRAGTTPHGKPVRIWPDTEVQIRAFMMSERKRRQVAA